MYTVVLFENLYFYYTLSAHTNKNENIISAE